MKSYKKNKRIVLQMLVVAVGLSIVACENRGEFEARWAKHSSANGKSSVASYHYDEYRSENERDLHGPSAYQVLPENPDNLDIDKENQEIKSQLIGSWQSPTSDNQYFVGRESGSYLSIDDCLGIIFWEPIFVNSENKLRVSGSLQGYREPREWQRILTIEGEFLNGSIKLNILGMPQTNRNKTSTSNLNDSISWSNEYHIELLEVSNATITNNAQKTCSQ